MQDALEVIDRARELLPNARHIELIKYLEGGWSNRNYRIRVDGVDAVLRLKSPLSVAPDREYLYLENPLAPQVLAYDRACGDMITQFVEGELLVDSPISPQIAASFMRALHATIPPGIRTYHVEPVIDGYLEGLSLAKPLESIYQSLQWKPQVVAGCHNELNDWNVIKTSDGFCTLDWESAGDNDPIFDVIGLCYGLEFGDDDFAACIEAYDANVDPHHIRQTRILYQIREHAWALNRLRHGSDHKGIVKQKLDTEIEIHRLASS